MFDKETFFGMIREGIPGLYLFEGHPTNDIVVKPMDLLRENINIDIAEIKAHLGLSEEMSNEEVDAVASNYRIVRGAGSYSVGAVTVAVQIPMEFNLADITFTGTDGLIYKPTRLTPVRESDYSKVGSYYTVRLNVKAVEKGEIYNVAIGDVSSVSGLSFSPLFVSNEARFSGGSDEQSNASVILAIESAITDRSLTRKTGLVVRLLELHPELNWFKIVGSGEPEMTRDIYVVNNQSVHLGNVADVYLYPEAGYVDGIQLLTDSLNSNSIDIDNAPAIAPYKIEDANGDINPIYWSIQVRNSSYCNSLKEDKVIKLKEPNNKFSSSLPTVEFGDNYGVEVGNMFYNGVESQVIGVSSNSIYLDSSRDEGFTVARTFGVVYPSDNEWADSPYINYSASEEAYLLNDTGGIIDFLSIVTESDPHLKLYMVEVEDSAGNKHFHDIDEVTTNYLKLESNEEFGYSPKRYRIIKSNVMEELFSVKVENWIEPWHYFRASIVSPSGGVMNMSEDLILPLVSKVELGEVYIEIASGYYKITGIEYEGQTLYISIKYDSAEQDESVLINQALFSLSGRGNFFGSSKLSDIVSGDVNFYYRTYPLESVQENLDADEERIITTDYLAKIPYEAEVKVGVRYKGEVTAGNVAYAIESYINQITPLGGNDTSGKLLQASDIIDVCYDIGVDYVDLSTFYVKILTSIPDGSPEWATLIDYEYEIKGEDIKKDYVFKYLSTTDDIVVEQIL